MRNYPSAGIVAVLFLCLLFPACGTTGANAGNRAQALVTLSSLSPSSIMAGSPPFTLTVSGSNLQSEPQTLVWNGGQQLESVKVTASQATFAINASLIANPGNISIQLIDGINDNQVSNTLTLTVTPPGQTACSLFGMYAFLFTSSSGNPEAGVFGVDANGNVTGEEDLGGDIADLAYPMTGTCTNSATKNEGTLVVTLPPETISSYVASAYTFVLQQSSGGPAHGVLGDGGASTTPGSGVFVGTAPGTAITDGDYIFGVLGEDPYGDSGLGSQIAAAGRFTYGNAALSAGDGDINDGGTVSQSVSVSGGQASSPPDLWPRMLLNLSINGLSTDLAVYFNSSGSAFAVGFVATPFAHVSGSGVANVVGFLSPQANAGSYSNSSLNASFVYSTTGAPPPLCCWSENPSPTDTTIGIASGFDSSAGTFNLLFDNVSEGVANLDQTVTGATYGVASNGRTTVSYTSSGTARNYVYYLDNTNDGYILGLDDNAEFGFFQPQASGPFNSASINATFASGTSLPETPGSPNLVTELTLNNGNLTASTASGALSGTYSISSSGRGTATVNLPVLGGTDLVLYVIDPQSVLLMGSDSTTSDAITSIHF